jgi:hypothetical protein
MQSSALDLPSTAATRSPVSSGLKAASLRGAGLPDEETIVDRLNCPSGADDGIRTRDPHLGKVVLYQLSHVRAGPDSSGARPR